MSVTAELQVAAGEKGNPTPSLLFSSLLFLGRSTAASTTGDGALGTLACACVGAGILTAYWEVVAVAQTTITTNLNQTLDVHLDFPTKVTFDLEVLPDVIT